MCLIICAHQYHSKFPLVITSNRDELFSRPTQTAQFRRLADESVSVLAGKDLVQGGTWLGISESGRFAAVTNVRGPKENTSATKSRGFLTSDFLHSDIAAKDYLNELVPTLDLFQGFNLLLGDREALFYLNSQEREIQQLEPGIYGLSNGKLDSPWPKVEQGKERLKCLLEPGKEVELDSLIDIMTDKKIAPDEELPSTGIPVELERLLSASFICNTKRGYGTRCSTAIVVGDDGTVRFSEQNYNEDTTIASRHFFEFSLRQST